MVVLPPLYVINMPWSPERWKSIQSDLMQHGLVPARKPAVDGQDIDDTQLVQMGVSLRTTLRLISGRVRHSHWMIDAKGAVGCTLSHIKAWKTLHNSTTASFAIIIEDDATIMARDLPRAIADLTRSNLPGFDVVLLTSNGRIYDLLSGQFFNQTSDTNSVHAVTKDFRGTHGYCLSKGAASVLLQYVFPIEQHVDHYIASLSRLRLLRIGATSSVLIGRGRSPSTISHGLLRSQYAFRGFLLSMGICLWFMWWRRRP